MQFCLGLKKQRNEACLLDALITCKDNYNLNMIFFLDMIFLLYLIIAFIYFLFNLTTST